MDSKLSLPEFLKLLTSNNVPASKAMGVAGKLYKTHQTPSQLGQLTDGKLKAAGVDDKEVRKLVLAAIRKSGYRSPAAGSSSRGAAQNTSTASATDPPTASTSAQAERPRKKRKRDDDLNEFLPDRPPDDGEFYGSLDFKEMLDEEALVKKSTVVNRAPIMMAWAFVVAERLGFQREEALSIASVYTEMNAITKGVSLGIYTKEKGKGAEAVQCGSQPYVDLMGRRPLYQTASGSWWALSSGTPVAPSSAFSYITRALRQTAPYVLGALRLLADSYTPAELNRVGFALYADFRPDVQGWGGRAEVRCATILGLRNKDVKKEVEEAPPANVQGVVKTEPVVDAELEGEGEVAKSGSEEPPNKKQHIAAIDEYEAALDDPFFDAAELDLAEIP